MVGNVFASPRTTTAGVLGILLAQLGQVVIPAIASFLGAQPSPGWQVLGLALGALGPALMSDAAKRVQTSGAPPVAPVALALIVGSLLFAAPARADDMGAPLGGEGAAVPEPATLACFDAAGRFCLRPAVSFAGSAYDLSSKTILRSVTAAGLLELTLGSKVSLIVGPGFQTGDAQGLAIFEGIGLPLNLMVGLQEIVIGNRASVTLAFGKVTRF